LDEEQFKNSNVKMSKKSSFIMEKLKSSFLAKDMENNTPVHVRLHRNMTVSNLKDSRSKSSFAHLH
jgi:hypothetical protein